MSHGFENLVALIFARKGWWVQTSYKVQLTREEKRKIGRPSSPRWELDVIAYRANPSVLLVIECKSLMDSPGVAIKNMKSPPNPKKNRYKLFNEDTTREVVLSRLQADLAKAGLIAPQTTVRLGLAAGKVVRESDRLEIHEWFKAEDWEFFDPQYLRLELEAMAQSRYENEVAAFTAKLLLRSK